MKKTTFLSVWVKLSCYQMLFFTADRQEGKLLFSREFRGISSDFDLLKNLFHSVSLSDVYWSFFTQASPVQSISTEQPVLSSFQQWKCCHVHSSWFKWAQSGRISLFAKHIRAILGLQFQQKFPFCGHVLKLRNNVILKTLPVLHSR